VHECVYVYLYVCVCVCVCVCVRVHAFVNVDACKVILRKEKQSNLFKP
jgi:hypothetical protein